MAKKEVQNTLPGIPEPIATEMFRVNYQYQGPKYALRATALILPARDIREARAIALETINAKHGPNTWTNITSIVQIQGAPF